MKKTVGVWACSLSLVACMGLSACAQDKTDSVDKEETAEVVENDAETTEDDSDDATFSNVGERDDELIEETEDDEGEVEEERGEVEITLSDAYVTVPADWDIVEDKSPTQLTIKNGRTRIEFWCGEGHARSVLASGDIEYNWRIGDDVYEGYDINQTDSVLVSGTLTINTSSIYEQELSRFLEYNVRLR